MTHPLDVHAVLFKEGDWWVGQWLEYDIAAQAATVKDLIYEMHRTLIGHIAISHKEGLPQLSGLQKAPDKFWKMYHSGMGVKVEPVRSDFNTPDQLPALNQELLLVA